MVLTTNGEEVIAWLDWMDKYFCIDRIYKLFTWVCLLNLLFVRDAQTEACSSTPVPGSYSLRLSFYNGSCRTAAYLTNTEMITDGACTQNRQCFFFRSNV